VQGIVRDLTERDRLEAELRQSQKLEGVGRLAGGVAHDFNNLLMIIQGYTDMALSQLDKEAPLRTDLTEISKAAERGGSLTRQLLAFSRKQVLRVAPLELNRLVEDTANILGLLLGDRIHLDLKLSHEPCPIEADRSQLEHVLITLATNARDAMSGAGTLRIEVAAVEPPEPIQVAKDSRYIRVRMHDTGCGMDQETMAQVFDPFFTTKTLGSGTGLGLATAYGTVKQLGGHIEVDSAPLQGTTFTVYFPRTDKPIVLPTEGPVQESAGGSETVLLVEDDAAVRRISRTALQRYGYEVLEADGPRAALKLATSHAERIDLVLTDVMMPEMTGPEMVALLKSICPTARVLFISGYANDTLVRDGVLPADVDLVQKPIATRDLLAAVRHVLGMRASAPSPGMATLSVH